MGKKGSAADNIELYVKSIIEQNLPFGTLVQQGNTHQVDLSYNLNGKNGVEVKWATDPRWTAFYSNLNKVPFKLNGSCYSWAISVYEPINIKSNIHKIYEILKSYEENKCTTLSGLDVPIEYVNSLKLFSTRLDYGAYSQDSQGAIALFTEEGGFYSNDSLDTSADEVAKWVDEELRTRYKHSWGQLDSSYSRREGFIVIGNLAPRDVIMHGFLNSFHLPTAVLNNKPKNLTHISIGFESIGRGPKTAWTFDFHNKIWSSITYQ